MTVCNSEDDDLHDFKPGRHGNPCSCCGGMLQYPFLAWGGEGEGFCLCSICCQRCRDGLIADLIHCAAIAEMQELPGDYYKHTTLVRKNVAAKAEKENEAVPNYFKIYGPRSVDNK